MTITRSFALAAVLGLAAAATATAQATAKTSTPAHRARSARSLASQAKISADSAQRVALAQVPNGTVKSHELEREHGKLIYSFDITVAGQSGVEEVNVSAIDGSVIAHEHENAAAEKKEAKQERAEHAAKKRAAVKHDSAAHKP